MNEIQKRGNTVLTLPFVIIISLVLILVFGIFVINTIVPFIWYEKLQHISYKYTYVLEKYGYLTDNEKTNLIQELEERGFDKDEIKIDCSSSAIEYGSIIEFKIKYNYKQKLPSWKGSLKMITKNIPINVSKTIMSKN